jgi:hypothetical protein
VQSLNFNVFHKNGWRRLKKLKIQELTTINQTANKKGRALATVKNRYDTFLRRKEIALCNSAF